jgi:nucleotide-binding universal stress UspA family protein
MMARGQQKGTRMYKTILVTLDCTATDRAIIEHIKQLAKVMQSRVVLLHVATGALAKYHGENAAGAEVEESRAYLDRVQAEFVAVGIPADAELAYGEPVKEIVHWVRQKKPDLVAMSTHGHHFMADLVLGTTAITVQHSVSVPVLLLRAR